MVAVNLADRFWLCCPSALAIEDGDGIAPRRIPILFLLLFLLLLLPSVHTMRPSHSGDSVRFCISASFALEDIFRPRRQSALDKAVKTSQY
jgi:hypothetical protein